MCNLLFYLLRGWRTVRETNSYDKTLMEKLRLLDSLDDVEKKSIYNLIDSLISKKKLKDNLSNLLDQ